MAVEADGTVFRMGFVAFTAIEIAEMVCMRIVGLHILGSLGKRRIVTVAGLTLRSLHLLGRRRLLVASRTRNPRRLMPFGQRLLRRRGGTEIVR